jgi:hypothetical protein
MIDLIEITKPVTAVASHRAIPLAAVLHHPVSRGHMMVQCWQPWLCPLAQCWCAARHRPTEQRRQSRWPRVLLSMKMIAARQARRARRGAPPRAREGGGGSSGWMRCHNASSRSLLPSSLISSYAPPAVGSSVRPWVAMLSLPHPSLGLAYVDDGLARRPLQLHGARCWYRRAGDSFLVTL